MKEIKIFYRFKILSGWFYLNLILTLLTVAAFVKCPTFFCWPEISALAIALVCSWLIWAYIRFAKHVMAVVTDKYIKIDHNNPLLWKDVKDAEERVVRCGLKKRKVLILNPKEDIDYKYNFLQKHNGEFTAFCIPLYGILTPEDEAEITNIVAKKVSLKRLD